MNRQQRRRADRQLRRAMRRGEVEGGLTPTCGYPDCGAPVGFGLRTMQEASDLLREHYAAKHGGREPTSGHPAAG